MSPDRAFDFIAAEQFSVMTTLCDLYDFGLDLDGSRVFLGRLTQPVTQDSFS